MASLTREVVFGSTSNFTIPDDFTQILAQQGVCDSGPAHTPASLRRESSAGVTRDAHQGPRATGATFFVRKTGVAEPLLGSEGRHAEQEAEPQQEGLSAKEAFASKVRFGIRASWVVNWLLLIAKVAAFGLSRSYSVLASAVDSLVDLLSQAVLAVAEHQVSTLNPRYPVGRTRVAEVSVIWCAIIMFISTVLVIRESVGALVDGFRGNLPELDVGPIMYAILGVASVAKMVLYVYCRVLRKNPIMTALAEDHWNDVLANVGALGGAVVAYYYPALWYIDASVAVLFSLIIIKNWTMIVKEQSDKIVGLLAPEELIDGVMEVSTAHHPDMKVDRVTAYHHGAHFVVEVEVVLPEDMTVRQSHDMALSLQHKIEAIDDVERAYVHVDYQTRSLEEHKVERNLKLGERDVMKPLTEEGSGTLVLNPSPRETNLGVSSNGNGNASSGTSQALRHGTSSGLEAGQGCGPSCSGCSATASDMAQQGSLAGIGTAAFGAAAAAAASSSSAGWQNNDTYQQLLHQASSAASSISLSGPPSGRRSGSGSWQRLPDGSYAPAGAVVVGVGASGSASASPQGMAVAATMPTLPRAGAAGAAELQAEAATE